MISKAFLQEYSKFTRPSVVAGEILSQFKKRNPIGKKHRCIGILEEFRSDVLYRNQPKKIVLKKKQI